MELGGKNWEMVYHFREHNLVQLSSILKSAIFSEKKASPENNCRNAFFNFFLQEGLNKGDYILEAREMDSWNFQKAGGNNGPEAQISRAKILAVKIQDSKVSLMSDLWELSFFGTHVWFSVYKLKPNTNNP